MVNHRSYKTTVSDQVKIYFDKASTDNMKYLGIIIDNRLRWDARIDYMLAKCEKPVPKITALCATRMATRMKLEE